MTSFATPNDAVALKPMWSALFSSLRFARWARWRFGGDSAIVSWHERGARSRLVINQPGAGPLRFRFDLRRWAGAFARSSGRAREIGFVADNGSPIASLRLEHVDAAIDELIWRLIDDAAASPVAIDAPADRDRVARVDALRTVGPAVARRLAQSALPVALAEAQRAGLALRVRVENAGGEITWVPSDFELDVDAGRVALFADGVDVLVPSAGAGVWTVERQMPGLCCPAIECYAPGDCDRIRFDVVAETDAACVTWRRICEMLPENV
jgi:hypothetical protein